jgi:sterol desaturase/sphingolipid hydroxylase (fatty acid hydroxylase superfamily)
MKHFKRNKACMPLIFIVVFAAISAVIMLLWNALLPAIFGVTTINFCQAAGIIILSRLLFGGFGKFHGINSHHTGFHGAHMKKDFFDIHDKLKNMSCDERREFLRKRMEEDKNEEK